MTDYGTVQMLSIEGALSVVTSLGIGTVSTPFGSVVMLDSLTSGSESPGSQTTGQTWPRGNLSLSVGGGGMNQTEADTRYVNVDGDVMIGDLTLKGSPTTALMAATKAYVDTKAPAPVRNTANKTTASLASGASESGLITLSKGYRLLGITTSRPARTRLYTTTAKRDADASRALGAYPTGDHGLIFEYLTTTGALTAELTPAVDGYDGKASPDGSIPYSITNLDSTTGTVAVTLVWLMTE